MEQASRLPARGSQPLTTSTSQAIETSNETTR
jgi:hypothetical protein